jgi:hypothetical protein
MSNPPHQRPGSDIRIVLRGLVYECQNQRDTGKYKFSGAVLDLTFAIRVRGKTGANVKSTAPWSKFVHAGKHQSG